MSWRTAGVHTAGRVGRGVLVDVGVSILKLDAWESAPSEQVDLGVVLSVG
jgi:hypothetical protein